ncbi:MAG: enoyl-CoA hydratase/isomerase family protein [Acidimicrobiales bacterium]
MNGEVHVGSLGDGHLSVTLAAPDRANALTAGLVSELTDALIGATREPGVRSVTLRGDGRHFCGGFDLSSMGAQDDETVAHRFLGVQRLLETVGTLPVLTIASVHGAAYGAGADLALSCDVRLGTGGARFAFPGYRFDVALGTARLVDTVGRTRALDVLMSGRPVDAPEALDIGILTELVSDESELESAAQRWRNSADRLETASLERLLGNVRFAGHDAAYAALSRSAARPGLAERITEYANSVKS